MSEQTETEVQTEVKEPVAEVKDWRNSLYPKHKGDSRFEQFKKGLPEVAQAYLETDDALTAMKTQYEGVELPPEEYEITDPENLSDLENENIDEQRQWVVDLAKTAKLSNAQANSLWEALVGNTLTHQQAGKEAAEVSEEEAAAAKVEKDNTAKEECARILKEGSETVKGWGDDYEANMQHVSSAIKQFASENWAEMMDMEMADGARFGDHPDFIHMLYNIGKGMATDTEITGERGAGEANPDEVREKKLAEMYPDTPVHRTTEGGETTRPEGQEYIDEFYADTPPQRALGR